MDNVGEISKLLVTFVCWILLVIVLGPLFEIQEFFRYEMHQQIEQ